MFTTRVILTYDKLGIIAAGLVGAVETGCSDTADEIVDIAKGLVAVETGALQGTIRKRKATGISRLQAGYEVVAGDLRKGVDYAVFQEYGTSTQPGTPYLVPAAEQMRSRLPEHVAIRVRGLEAL